MKVTVTEFSADPAGLAKDWDALVAHVKENQSELVLMPEMALGAWLPITDQVDLAKWDAAVTSHERWLERVPELFPAIVCGTRPINEGGKRFNEVFAITEEDGYQALHRKTYLPNEPGFWEATWYDRAPVDFTVTEIRGVRLGVLVCTEMWFMHHAREAALAGAHIILSPRAAPWSSVPKWIAGGRANAVVAGAYSLGANRGHSETDGMLWGGAGWIIDPEGTVMTVTDEDFPFVTANIDLTFAEKSKQTYPRYVDDSIF